VKNSTGLYRRVHTDADGTGVVSHAGGVALLDTVLTAGLDRAPGHADVDQRHVQAQAGVDSVH